MVIVAIYIAFGVIGTIHTLQETERLLEEYPDDEVLKVYKKIVGKNKVTKTLLTIVMILTIPITYIGVMLIKLFK